MTISGYFPEVELLSEERGSEAQLPEGQSGGKWTQPPFAVVSVSVVRLAFV